MKVRTEDFIQNEMSIIRCCHCLIKIISPLWLPLFFSFNFPKYFQFPVLWDTVTNTTDKISTLMNLRVLYVDGYNRNKKEKDF